MKDIDAIAHRMTEAGNDWADKESAASVLEETRRAVRSEIMVEYIQKGESAAASEAKAEADPRYKAHVTAMCEARRVANRAKVRWIVAQQYSKLIQTAEASKRAEMTMR